MIVAEYLGDKCCRLQIGKVYKITTKCIGFSLVVSCSGGIISYSNLEQFLNDWKVRAVYNEQSGKA